MATLKRSGPWGACWSCSCSPGRLLQTAAPIGEALGEGNEVRPYDILGAPKRVNIRVYSTVFAKPQTVSKAKCEHEETNTVFC